MGKELYSFQEWQRRYAQLRAIGERISSMRHERALKIAQAHGIPDLGCCCHNASIATIGQGWGADDDGKPGSGRARIKAARRALRIVNDWQDPKRYVSGIISRWDKRVRGY